MKGENIEDKEYKVWITLIEGMGYQTYKKIITKFKTLESIWNAKEGDLNKLDISKKIKINLINREIKKDTKRHLEYMKKNDIDIIYIEDKEYPKKLKTIYDPPICLYVRGDKKILNNKCLAIVGCRDYTEYGKNNALKFSYEISKRKINIVSGLAKGIDAFAHLGAVKAKEKTIAILGNGLDISYPTENKKLAEEIIKNNGAILSEYPLGTKPNKINFPARNRIISGMSNAVLVVEAKEKSGTLITVDFALEQGRDVFAIPGNINFKNSFGTNDLIKQGATIVTKSEDIIYNI